MAMKILYILPVAAVSFMLLCCKGGDIREDKYPDGSVRLSTPYVQGKREGVEKEFYESGKLKATRHYKAGVITDTVTEFFESGKTKSVTPYKDGAVEGFVVRYYDNGNVASKTLYAKGLIAAFPEEYDSLGNPAAKGTYEDPRDHKKYDWVRIGGNVWTAQNIDFATESGSVCMQCNVWGRLYDFKAVKSACPAGFHIPGAAEWNALIAAAGAAPSKALKATFGWDPIGNTGEYGNGTDSLGFDAQAGGAHFAPAATPIPKRVFRDAGQKAYFWASDGRVMVFYNAKPAPRFEAFNAAFGASLRCVLGPAE